MQYENIQSWKEEAVKLFGKDWKEWQFKCTHCDNTQSGKSLIEGGLSEDKARNDVYQNCKKCDHKSYGLIHSNITVCNGEDITYVFPFSKTIKD